MHGLRVTIEKIRELYRNSEICQRLGKVEGIGPVTATALIAAVGDRSSFKNGRQFMHNPWRHGAGFDPYPSIVARVSAQGGADLFWNRRALTSPYSPAVLVNDANRRHLLRNVQANKMGHR